MESDSSAKPRKGDDCQHEDAREAQGDYLPRSAALQEGELRSPQHVNDQGLAPHGFNEPAGLENGNKEYLSGGIKGVISTAAHSRADDEVHENIGYDIKDRADRT